MGWLTLVLAASLSAGPAQEHGDPTTPPLIQGQQEERAHEGTEIHFLSYRGDETHDVTVGDQTCSTPCTLKLHPGPAKVHVIGTGESDLQMVIPHLTAQVRLSTGPPSWYLPAGVVLVPSGIVVAASLWALGLACGFNSGACTAVNIVSWPVIGASMLVVGAVLLGIYNRAQPVDANRPEILDAQRTTGLRFEGFSLAPTRNGAGGALALSF